MTVGLDGSTGVAAGSGTTQQLTLSTTNANDVIIVGVLFSTLATSVSGVASTHLTFTQRASVGPNAGLDVWSAVASSALSSEVITISFAGGSSAFTSAVAFGISGANTSTIWDSNGGLPVLSTAAADPVISTTNGNDFIYGIMQFSAASTPTAGTGWTPIYNGAGGYLLAEYKIVSSPQSSLTVAVGTGSGGEKYSIADAVIQGTVAGIVVAWIT